MKLTIIVPCYNEKKTINTLVTKLKKLKFNKQIILVDDCSNDGTRELIENHIKYKVDKVIFHKKNIGKGGAIISAKKFVKGEYVVIQDADLEYDPRDLIKMLIEIKKYKYKVLYGSRVLGKNKYKRSDTFTSNYRVFANFILTILSNFINHQKLTDAHTCYKMFNTKIFKKINLNENGFSFCPEITTKVSKLGLKIFEIPIKYKGRTYQQGKKISLKDGFDAIFCLFKYRYFS